MGKIFMSIGTIGISINWLLEGGFHQKLNRLKELKWAPFILSLLFILHVIWIINTKTEINKKTFDFLLIKFPLFCIPIVIGTSEFFNKKELKILLRAFFTGLILSTLISIMIYFDILHPKERTGDFRELSRFIHHIRYSLLISISIIITLYLVLNTNIKEKKWLIIVMCWLFLMLLFIPSMTGMAACLIAVSIIIVSNKNNFSRSFYYIGYLWVLGLILISFYTCFIISGFYQIKDECDLSNLQERSINGEKYIHNTNDLRTENGYFVWINIAPNECKRSWNSVSNYDFESKDKKGQALKFTLYRYLSSKGLTKDSIGMSFLSKNDIIKIENGKTTSINYNGIENRIREILLEIELFLDKGEANRHSVSQRVIFLKAGLLAFKKNFWLGVGPGGIKDEISKQYEFISQDFEEETKKKGVHNQFLTLLITFGAPGFILFLIALIYPIIFLKKKIRPLYIAFSLIIVIGFLSDDMLDRQAGVAIFIVINSILLFAIEKKDQSILGGSKV